MKRLSLSNKFLVLGGILVGVFNPLAVALWSDALVIGINFLAKQLVLISHYTTIVGGTLLVAGFIIYLDSRSKKETKRLKKLKTGKSNVAGEYLA